MKKVIKRISIFLLLMASLVGIILYIHKDKIMLYINVGKKYMDISKNASSMEVTSINSLKQISSMDYKDVVYKNTKGVPLTLDIYGPKKKLKKGSPVILYVHGGSWAFGNKALPEILTPMLDSFREEGFSIVSTSYELMKNTVNFEKQASDIKDTIRWIHKNKDIYGFNEDEIGVIGISSGAHLSLLAAYTDDNEFSDDKNLLGYSSKAKYVIDLFGPTDLKTLDMNKAGSHLSGLLQRVKNKEAIMDKFSPVNYVNSSIPNTLIVHSKTDELVPFKNATLLYDKCKDNKSTVELLTLEKSGHDFQNINTDEVISLANKILKFIIKESPL